MVTLKLRSSEFKTRTHQRGLHHPTNDPFTIFQMGKTLLDKIWSEKEGSVRLIGISIGHLFRPGEGGVGMQEDIFESCRIRRLQGLFGAVDRLRDTYGEDVLGFAGGMEEIRRGSSHQALHT
jgi:hypothetical protein